MEYLQSLIGAGRVMDSQRDISDISAEQVSDYRTPAILHQMGVVWITHGQTARKNSIARQDLVPIADGIWR